MWKMPNNPTVFVKQNNALGALIAHTQTAAARHAHGMWLDKNVLRVSGGFEMAQKQTASVRVQHVHADRATALQIVA